MSRLAIAASPLSREPQKCGVAIVEWWIVRTSDPRHRVVVTSRVRSQGSDRTGHRVAMIVMRAGDRAGSGVLPGVRPSDNPRTRLFVNADGNIAAVRRCNPRGTRGPVSRKYASPIAALPELLSPDGHGSNNTGLVR